MRSRLLLLLCLRFPDLLAQVPVQPALATPAAPRKFKPVTAILGAFPDEVTLLEGKMRNRKERYLQGVRFLTGKLNGQPIILARTGIGKVNAAATTTLLLEHFRPREVLFTGIAGGINPSLAPGDLVIGTRLAHHDYGTLTEKG
ncbi:MAG: 5'-methylthioadenosine/S-adenosylhomocysteine nucleosidase, partial [Ferruginibacter sp.]|nr:5'-methylthioadenosine/S-adenosylhomocysteine nucleosidase [Cytophagales bacterium]